MCCVIMNLKNFESHIEAVILERGIDYYTSGNVVSLEYDGTEWVAKVEGSNDYTVTVKLSENGEILETYCDCPYDGGEYCKHQVAVFYELTDKLKSGELSEKKTKDKNLEDLLYQLNNVTLVSIVMELARKDRRIKEELFLRYEDQGSIFEHARNVIQSSISKVKRRGYVEYADVGNAVDGAYTVLKIIDAKIDNEDNFSAVSLCIVILEEMVDLIAYCDDSGGTVGEIIREAIEKISEAVHAVKPNQNDDRKKFDLIFDHALLKMYEDWADWRWDILFSAVPLCGNSENRKKMEQYISEYISSATSEWSRGYETRQLQKIQYEIIKQFDGKEKADFYLEQHIENSDFRDIVIQNAISGKLYEKALNLCLDGEIKDSAYIGLVYKWKELRYTIYEKMNDKKGQKNLGMELLLHGEFEYFLKLKPLYTDAEWPAILQNILEKAGAGSGKGVYIKILIHEKLKPLILKYCKEHSGSITSYYKHLLPEYKRDVSIMFRECIKKNADYSNGRGHYRRVCEIISEYKKACGQKAAYAIRDELAMEHARRPAFLDELSKL